MSRVLRLAELTHVEVVAHEAPIECAFDGLGSTLDALHVLMDILVLLTVFLFINSCLKLFLGNSDNLRHG
jgi:hypothetical protein